MHIGLEAAINCKLFEGRLWAESASWRYPSVGQKSPAWQTLVQPAANGNFEPKL